MQRIQKILAQYGLASRRTIEEWIKLERIKINNKIAKLGDQITGNEEIKIDNKTIKIKHSNSIDQEQTKIILYHKPAGKICTRSDPQHRPTVYDDLPILTKGRWVAVGRLDLTTSGILLFTNNGTIANKLMHPSYNQEREYLVRIFGNATPQNLSNFIKGVKLKDGINKFKKIQFIRQKTSNSWYKVTLTEGKNREIKRLFESQNLTVNRLIRIRFGKYILPKTLKMGEHIERDWIEN